MKRLSSRRFEWRRGWIWAAGAVAMTLLLAVIGFVVWAYPPAQPMPEAYAALRSSEQVTVTEARRITFMPTGKSTTTAFIFYPGARVDPRAYAPPARAIALQGHPVIIVPMPFNLALLGRDRATDVMEAYPDVERWVIGGHSMGGAMAAIYAGRHPDAVHGLVLWAAYPTRNGDLSDRLNLATVSVYGTLDGIATVDEVLAGAARLPADAAFVAIDGGNHAQFGWYGNQDGDHPATITREEQQSQAVAATLPVLEDEKLYLLLESTTTR